jgi:hypothetical protein
VHGSGTGCTHETIEERSCGAIFWIATTTNAKLSLYPPGA